MQNPENITIGLLLITAVILGTMLMSSFMATDSAALADTPVKGGDYILGTGAWSDTTDLIYVIDIATRRLNVYNLNTNTGNMDLGDAVDLDKEFSR